MRRNSAPVRTAGVRMKATRSLLTALVILAGTHTARAQTADVILGAGEPPPATATELLTAPPNAGQYPPGTYASPWCGGHGCTGPVGRNGPLTYEVYALVGASLPVGGSELSATMKTGVEYGGGARTLWFRNDDSAAWVLDLGITNTYNRGQADRSIIVATPRTSPVVIDPITGQQTGGERIFPDGLASYQLRSISRTNFNFGVGRDWWFGGPGTVQMEESSNFRFGADVGGRWGTAHVNLVPRADSNNYQKRSGVIHGTYIGMHMDWDKPMGAWIFFCGLRAEWGYTFTNLVPPLGGDIHDVNILFTFGARF